MPIVSWLHLSDWHQGGGDFDRKVVAEALVDDIKRRASFDTHLEKLSFFFLTGDLAWRGVKVEFETARDLLLEPVREVLGLQKDRLFVIPGNHDLDRTRLRLVPAAINHPFASREEANDWLNGEEERELLLKPFSAYQQFVQEYGVPGFSGFAESRTVAIDDQKVGIIGCNSALMCGRNHLSDGTVNDDRMLTVGEAQIHTPLRQIADTGLRISLIHHPFEWLQDIDRDVVERRMQETCHFILRGHIHNQGFQTIGGTAGNVVTVLGGACYNGRIPDRPEYINAYNFVVFNTDTGNGTVYLRRWSLNNTGWTADTDRGDPHGRRSFQIREFADAAKKRKIRDRKSASTTTSRKTAARKSQELSALRKTYLEYCCTRWVNLDMRGIMQTGRVDTVPVDEVYTCLTAGMSLSSLASRAFVAERKWPVIIDSLGDSLGVTKDLLKGTDVDLTLNSPAENFNQYWKYLSDIGRIKIPNITINIPDVISNYESHTFSTKPILINSMTGTGKSQAFFSSLINYFALQRDREVEIDLPNALHDFARIVILGDPGAGKTTLARFLARRFALALLEGDARVQVPVYKLPTIDRPHPEVDHIDDYGDTRLPLLLRVADFAEALRRDSNIRLRDFLPYARAESNLTSTEATDLFEDALNHGQALIILDGLDEVAQNHDRVGIARRIDDFINGIGSKNRLIVTSRIAGYSAARLTSDVGEITLRDMEFRQIERFVTHRMVAYSRAQTPGATEAAIVRAAQPDISAILSAVQENDGVKRLAVNPLLLTILCLIHRTGKRLPERRVDLYEKSSVTLLVDWRPAQTERSNSAVEMAEADRLLAPLADWMHESDETGRIQTEQAIDLMRGFCAERHGLAKQDPKVESEVQDFWRRLTYETSVFVERMPDEFAFLHLTFEEYWAARYLVSDYTQACERIRIRRHNPRFEEVIRLAIASQTEANAANHIRQAIWCPPQFAAECSYSPSGFESTLRRDLLLASKCLSDCTLVEPAMADAIADALVAICLNRDGAGRFSELIALAKSALQNLQHNEAGARAQIKLLSALKERNNSIRVCAIMALLDLGIPSPETHTMLIDAIQDPRLNLLVPCVLAATKFNIEPLELINAILSRLKTPDHRYDNIQMRLLGVAITASPEAIQTLILALTDPNTNVRRATAAAIGAASAKSDAVVQALVRATRDVDLEVRQNAISALRQACGTSDAARHTVIDALKNGEAKIRATAANTLSDASRRSDEVVGALLGALKDSDHDVRDRVVSALAGACARSSAAIQGVLAAIQDPNSNVRQSVIYALQSVSDTNTQALGLLLQALTDKDNDVRLAAAIVLQNTSGSLQEPQALFSAIEDTPRHVRDIVIQTLGNLGKTVPAVVTATLDKLVDSEPTTRFSAVCVLEIADQRSSTVLAALSHALNDEHKGVRNRAAHALVSMSQTTPPAIEMLIEGLSDSDAGIRYTAAAGLEKASESSPLALQSLLAETRHPEEDVRLCAIRALRNANEMSEDIKNAIETALQDTELAIRNAAWQTLRDLCQKIPLS